MTARELLRQAKEAQLRILDINNERQRLRELAEGSGISYDGGLHAPSAVSSKVERTAVSLADLDARLQGELRSCTILMSEAAALIDRIPVDRYRRLLRLRYLSGMDWPRIQREMGYTVTKNMYRAHRRALELAEKYFQNED